MNQHIFWVDDQALEHTSGDQGQALPWVRVAASHIVECRQSTGHGAFDHGGENIFFADEIVVD